MDTRPVDSPAGAARFGPMCSRIDQSPSPVGGYLGALGVAPPAGFLASGNVRPTDPVLAVREAEHTAAGGSPDGLEAVALRWGFEGHGRGPVINARAETAHALPMFRDALRRRRCIVPVARFYEWTALPCEPGEPDLLGDATPVAGAGASARKAPHAFAMPDGAAYVLAGLWTAGRLVILTVTASPAVAPYHDRMPAILPPEHVGPWLWHGQPPAGAAHPLLVPFDGPLVASAVHKFPA